MATAHPAKFSMAIKQALGETTGFNFERDVLPDEFRDFLGKERRVEDVDHPKASLVKKIIEAVSDRKGQGA